MSNATPVNGQTGGTVSPGGNSIGTLNAGDVALGAGSNLRIDMTNSLTFDALNAVGTVDVTNANLKLIVVGALNVSDSFTILANDGGDSVVGQFLGGTTITSSNDPRYVFSVDYAGGDGNDIVATVSSIITTTVLDVDAAGLVTVASADNLNNNLSITQSGGNFVVTDPAGVITLSSGATSAGWTGSGANTVTGPVASVTGFAINLNNGNDTVDTFDAGSAPIAVSGTGSLSVAGLVSTTDDVTVSGVTSIAGAGTIQGNHLNLSTAGGIGDAGQRLHTAGSVIAASAGSAGMFLSEADGADFSATTSGGVIDILNNSGTLNVADPMTTANGNIILSSADAVTLSADLNAGNGTIAIAANTDGLGADSYDQKGASLHSSNTAPNAVSITVNTPADGTGDAIIGMGTIGDNSGGAITVNSNGGNILWSNDSAYLPFGNSQTGLDRGGSNVQTLKAYAYHFTTTAAGGSVGTDARPLQLDNFGSNEVANPDPNLTASAGTGGVFVTDWGTLGNDLTTGPVSAQGAGNIRIVAANSGGHNLWIGGNITTGTGTISLYADDELTITPTGSVGGAGFSGIVDILGNRDRGQRPICQHAGWLVDHDQQCHRQRGEPGFAFGRQRRGHRHFGPDSAGRRRTGQRHGRGRRHHHRQRGRRKRGHPARHDRAAGQFARRCGPEWDRPIACPGQ